VVGTALRDRYARQATAERGAWERLVAGIRETGLPVPVLSVCGHGTAEVRFTKLLRHYLDPLASHGLGTRCLRAIFGDDVGHVDARVEAEVELGIVVHGDVQRDCYLDLLVLTPNEAILVEQKLFAAEAVDLASGERMTQLARYSRAFDLSFPAYGGRCRKYFLTPTGKSPSDDTSWQAVSHADWVNGLAAVLDDPELSPTARFNLLSLIWELLVGPLAMDERLPALGAIGRAILAHPSRSPALRRRALSIFPSLDLLLRIARELP
jgi:hypothetical protein